MPKQINALSIDLEEWYHPELIKRHVNIPKINLIQSSADMLLDLLRKYDTKATFFVLGEIAVLCPELIKKIYNNGHEIASHGFSHTILHELGSNGLRTELTEFKKIITNILGNIEIKGFRAPTFSLTQDTAWAVDILKENEFKYDSSVFPIRINSFLGVKNAPLNIYGLSANNITIPDAKSTLKEFPITVYEIWKFRFPVSGSFYLRLSPFCLQKKFLHLINKDKPFIIYIHPWECYNTIPRIRLNHLSGFVSYYNIKSALIKFEELLKNFNFDRIDKILGV